MVSGLFYLSWDNPGAKEHMYLTIFIYSILNLNLVKSLVSQSIPGISEDEAGANDHIYLSIILYLILNLSLSQPKAEKWLTN